jgi:hypothetical protein
MRSVIDTEMALLQDTYHRFTMTFDRPVPTPDKTITLKLERALLHPEHAAVPPIRFKKIRWKLGYT